MRHPTAALFLAIVLLLLPLQETHRGSLISFAAAAHNGGPGGPQSPPSSGGGGGKKGNGGSEDGDEESSQNKGQASSDGKSNKRENPPGKGPSPPKGSQSEPGHASGAIPLLWKTASNSVRAATQEQTDLEEFNAAIARMFDRKMPLPPRIRGALEHINEALSRDLLENGKNISPTERQKILYGVGGHGTYMEVPPLLLELRQEADHPVEEQRRIKALHRKRRRGIPIDMEDLKVRPYVKIPFEGPVTTTDMEDNLNDAEVQQRQAGVNGWIQMQRRSRQIQRQQLRRSQNTKAVESINDDDFQVDDEDVVGLSFNAPLHDEEGGEFLKKDKEVKSSGNESGSSENSVQQGQAGEEEQ